MDDKIELIVQALINGDSIPIEDFEPKSRSEAYLKSALMTTKVEDLPNPASRLDVLVCALHDGIHKEYDTKFDEGYGTGHTDGHTEGYTEGYEIGIAEGLETGKQSEYDRFWDNFQVEGRRVHYYQGFSGQGWTKDTFKPKYNILPQNQSCYGMFAYFNHGLVAFDLAEHLDGLGITLDLSGSTDTNYIFQGANVSRIGIVDISGCSEIANTFTSCKAVTIDKFIIKEAGSQAIYSPFSKCTNLENIVIEGKFGKSITFANSSNLTAASAKSIINALLNYRGTSSELTYKLTLPAPVWDRLESSETAPDGGTWKDYIVNVIGWQTA